MKRTLLVLLLIAMVLSAFVAAQLLGQKKLECSVNINPVIDESKDKMVSEALELLKIRKDDAAMAISEKVLFEHPADNLDALWIKAEVLRRKRHYVEAQAILDKLLAKDPNHAPSMISLAFIKYKHDKYQAAMKLVNQVLNSKNAPKEDQALAYMVLGAINGRRSSQSLFFNKIRYGSQVERYFLKASELAPDLAEVHSGLGTFYLLAPAIVGGDLAKAFKELELAVSLAPEFATANARLAQAYLKKRDIKQYNFYLEKAIALDPQNEVLEEIEYDRAKN